MKQCLFFILLFSQLTIHAQKKHIPWSFKTSLEINQLRTLGGSFSIQPSFGKYFALGAGVDLIRVRDISKNVVPVYLDASFKYPLKEIEPFLCFQGGINGYNETYKNANNSNVELRGHSFLGAGTGMTVGQVDAKLRLFWGFKYRVYQFSESLISPVSGQKELLRRPEKEQYSFSVGIVF